MSKKVLMALTSHAELGDTGEETGFTVPEAARPWQVFRDAGVDVDFVSVEGGEPPQEGFDEEDPVQREFLDRERDRLRSTPKASEVDPDRYDAIFFVGGHGTMWDFPDAKALTDAAVDIYERGGVVSAVCHGPAALVNAKLSDGSYLVAGKRLNSFTDAEERAMQREDVVPFLLQSRLEERGARWEGGEDFGEYAVADGRLVSGQNPASATRTARLVLEAMS
ncbi:MAG TPA: type 1 glutamine amidotransferase domain-containing protein [Glycomyces sp.]|nr:type 1 glutamine amidotransferase domain-containing protein [Glycomyces sp.]